MVNLGVDSLNIAVYSLFRDVNLPFINRYFAQISKQTYDKIGLYLVEGDSTNNTFDWLMMYAKHPRVKAILRHTTGQPYHRFQITPERMKALSETANIALDRIARDKWADKILLIESDLLIEDNLIEKLVESNLDVVAPMIYARESFYDIWGFRTLDGQMTTPTFNPKTKMELSSVGSVTLYPAQPIYDGLRFDDRCMVGLCNDLRERGYKIWVNPQVVVKHPV